MFMSDKDTTEQTPTTENNGSPAAPITPIEPTAGNAELGALERLRAENAELRQRQLDVERDARIKVAIAATRVQDSGPTNGEQAIRRQRAIAASKGTAFWNQIPIADRVAILTDGKRVPASTQEIGKFFGPKSSAIATTQLKASNPKAYYSYRAEAIELQLIG
jgi:hypothetical protein